eukprot:PhF_6_TR5649/c0_g1_i1/m.8253
MEVPTTTHVSFYTRMTSEMLGGGAQANDDDADRPASTLGYKQELHVGLGNFANFGFGFTEVNVFSSLVGALGLGLTAGGPPLVIWGWIVATIATTIVGCSMAEICSAYPCAGSVYHWAAQMTSPRWAPLWSYITGWLNFLGNAAGDASFGYSFATLFNAALIASGAQKMEVSGMVGVSILAVLVWSCLNILKIT